MTDKKGSTDRFGFEWNKYNQIIPEYETQFRKWTYPLTAKECVALICTDIAVIEVTKEGLILKEVAPGWRAEEVQALTEPRLILAGDLKDIEL